MRPLCFVLMAFGKKPVGDGRIVDFDRVYDRMIKPAVVEAGLEPLRADEEQLGGIIHKAMFERLLLCEFAVADLTTANANVFYELGVRHAVRPWATQLIFAQGWGQLPFDVASLRALPYHLGAKGVPRQAAEDAAALKARLEAARQGVADSPAFQLIEGFPEIQRLKADVFRDRVRYAEGMKDRLARARQAGTPEVEAIEAELGDVANAEGGIVVDLFLSYRAVEAWESMIALVPRMAPPLAATAMVQEQWALALNRVRRDQDAERVLLAVLDKFGPSSETYGILGRVYKDRWERAKSAGDSALANGSLDRAIQAYVSGFETDWRDAYPGINAVTLMEMKSPPDPRQSTLLPAIAYAVERRIASGDADYWDYATRLELAVLASNERDARLALEAAAPRVREAWEPQTTARNLRLIREARAHRQEDAAWVAELERELQSLADPGSALAE